MASDNGIKVLDAAAAENGCLTPSSARLQVPGLTKYGRAVGVAVTPDDKFAFVSLQFRDEVGVFNLGKAIRQQFDASASYYVGSLNVGAQPVGLTMSHDGTTLYATAFHGNSAVPGTLSVIRRRPGHELRPARPRRDQQGHDRLLPRPGGGDPG